MYNPLSSLGISVRVSQNGVALESDSKGYLGQLPVGSYQLEVEIPATDALFTCFTTAGKPAVQVIPASNRNKRLEGASSALYSQKVNLSLGAYSFPVVSTAQNHLSLLRVTRQGEVKTWEIALISVEGEIFLTIEEIYAFSAFRSAGRVSMPAFDQRWPQLVEFIRGFAFQSPEQVESLPDVDTFNPPAEITAEGLEEGLGRVKVWNSCKNFGVIATRLNGKPIDCLVFGQQISGTGERPILAKGQMVEIRELVPTDERDSTSFSHIARGVQPATTPAPPMCAAI